MTACRNKAKGAVVAALAGALTLGAAPVMALADGASLQALTPAEDFAQGTLTAATNGKGGSVEINEDAVYTFAAGSGEYLVPTEITTSDGPVTIVTGMLNAEDDNATLAYYAKGNTSTTVDPAKGLAAGSYIVKVTMKDSGYTCEIPFSVRGNLLAEATLFDNSNGAGDVTDTTFTYNLENQASTIGVALDGVALVKGEDYSKIEWKKVDDNGQASAIGEVKSAGSYIAVVKGDGDYAGQTVSIKFNVEKLNLTEAEITIDDVVKPGNGYLNVTGCVVNGNIDLNTSNAASLSIEVNEGYTGTGAYTATVSAQDGATNIEGSQTVSFNVVGKKLDSTAFFYGENNFADLSIDLSKGEKFDPSKIAVKDNGEDVKFDVWYTDADGNEVSESDLQQPGSYKVYARVDAAANYFDLGSDVESFTVNVTGGKVDENDVQYRYDGTDVLDKLETVVKQGDKTLVAGEDYEVVVKDEDGKKVDAIVNAGKYEITLESTKYYNLDDADNTLEVEVKQVKFAEVKVSDEGFFTTTTDSFLPYTGSVIETPKLVYSYYGLDGKVVTDENGETVWVEMPTECWDVDYLNFTANGTTKAIKVTEVKDAGTYEIVTKNGDGVTNYNGSEVRSNGKLNTEFVVSDTKVYTDVANNEWYSQYVYDAATKGYMTGYNGTTLFGPADTIKRGDVAVALFKMVGGSLQYDKVLNEGVSLDGIFYGTPFSDVDGHTYYA